jgi:hypothetical protein
VVGVQRLAELISEHPPRVRPRFPDCDADEDSIIHAVNCLGEDPAA